MWPRAGSGCPGCWPAQQSMTWTGRATYAAGYLDYWAGDSELAVRELQTAVDLLGEAASPMSTPPGP